MGCSGSIRSLMKDKVRLLAVMGVQTHSLGNFKFSHKKDDDCLCINGYSFNDGDFG